MCTMQAIPLFPCVDIFCSKLKSSFLWNYILHCNAILIDQGVIHLLVIPVHSDNFCIPNLTFLTRKISCSLISHMTQVQPDKVPNLLDTAAHRYRNLTVVLKDSYTTRTCMRSKLLMVFISGGKLRKISKDSRKRV